MQRSKDHGIIWLLVAILSGLLLLRCQEPAPAYAELSWHEQDRLLDAIWKAEGGEKAVVPYGLLGNEWCVEAGACRYYARSIVLYWFERWQEEGGDEPFIGYLGSKWAPGQAHWLVNVIWFVEHD